ncbi:DUF3592 domain-containing protein [Streptomyces sp. NPDC007904]|uniref:DUF3592 domain-containing protein n=1 Tax=Streptomyces sp. NPDC007904 TaxID=3364787 RepID=UPI0036E4CC3D
MIGILVFLLVVLTALIVNYAARSTLRRRGVQARATCVDQVRGSDGKYRVHMEYVDAGGATVRKVLGTIYKAPPLSPGAESDIVYDPEGCKAPLFSVDAYGGKWAPVWIAVVSTLTVLTTLMLFR